MAPGFILAFWTVSIVLICVPGADWAFILGAGLRGRSALPAVAGLALGYAGVTAVIAAGVGAVVARSPAALTSLTVVGGLYLMWHGVTTFVKPSRPGASPDAPDSSGRVILLRGIGVSGLNPKGLLILLSMLPQFIDQHGTWPASAQIGVLGLVFTLTCTAFYACLGAFARIVLHARPAAARALSRCSGAFMAVIGVVLVAERLAG